MIDLTDAPLTYLITKGEAAPGLFAECSREILSSVKRATDAGISLIQIREKHITTKQLFELAVRAVAIVSGSQTKLLINSRADVAIAAGANGVHLPENGIPVAAVRKVCPPPFLVGVSVHSQDAALSAKADGADFVLFGPVFDSPGKSGVGLEALAVLCRSLEGFPVIAVGGIDGSNYQLVLDQGAAGYAAIRYLNDERVLEKGI
ncbi:MAG TPA: thiamine phosphate synthase [Pyrinomonadaceae bacterium]|nr:thiamine phosphate synthase [Pyrinomonadaceae bacterium]